MEKILIKENALEAKSKIGKVENLIVEINQRIVPAFEDLSIGKLNTNLLHDLLRNNFVNVNNLISIQAEKDTDFIKTPAIKNEMLRVIDEIKKDFSKICKSIVNYDAQNFAKYIEVKAGIVQSIPGAREAIMEDEKYYISDPKEIEIYNEVKTISDAYNRILSKCGEHSKLAIRINGISDLLDFDPNTYESEPCEGLNYSSMVSL